MTLSLTVQDSAAKPDLATPRTGSAMELFFRDLREGKIEHVYLLPHGKRGKAWAGVWQQEGFAEDKAIQV